MTEVKEVKEVKKLDKIPSFDPKVLDFLEYLGVDVKTSKHTVIVISAGQPVEVTNTYLPEHPKE